MRTPLTVYGVTTPTEYKALQRKYLARVRKRAAVSTEHPPVVVIGDAYRLHCSCGEYTIVDPDWQLACCLVCGLIYEDLEIPEAP
jgi:hypothetical protein